MSISRTVARRNSAHLLQTGIFADCHAGHIHHNLLPAAVVEIEVVGVDGEGQLPTLGK